MVLGWKSFALIRQVPQLAAAFNAIPRPVLACCRFRTVSFVEALTPLEAWFVPIATFPNAPVRVFAFALVVNAGNTFARLGTHCMMFRQCRQCRASSNI